MPIIFEVTVPIYIKKNANEKVGVLLIIFHKIV